MADYRVKLDIFAGPLDLLLYLVRKEEVDIYDIPLAKITGQYIHYIEMLKSLDVDLAGDFLVMAATLIQIKSAMLLPKAQPEQMDSEDLSDPRTELIRQLLEYKKFKDASNLLGEARDHAKMRFARPNTIVEQLKEPAAEQEVDIEQVSVWDLLEAFDSIMQATGAMVDINSIKDDTPIDLYQIDILHRLQTEGAMSFEQIFEAGTNKAVMIGLFLALLELVREKLVWAKQEESEGVIYLRALTDEPAEQVVHRAIEEAIIDNGDEQERPPVEITELPAKSKTASSVETLSSEQTKIPIVELPAKKSAETLADKEKTEPLQE